MVVVGGWRGDRDCRVPDLFRSALHDSENDSSESFSQSAELLNSCRGSNRVSLQKLQLHLEKNNIKLSVCFSFLVVGVEGGGFVYCFLGFFVNLCRYQVLDVGGASLGGGDITAPCPQ